MTIKFQGSAIWIYGPPRSQLPAIPVDHKICLHENHRVASDIVCYRVDVAEAYSAAEDYNSPVVIFSKGGLQDHEHQIVVSVGDPTGEVDKHRGIQFSHAVYTIDRATPWPTDEDSWRFREVVIHDTHPLLSYSPKEPVSSGWWPWSPEPIWVSRGESNQDEWGVDVTMTAGAVALYGVPKAHITEYDSLSDACVRIDSGPCEIIDIKHAYLNVENPDKPVLLWQNQALDAYRLTKLSIRLVKTDESKLRVFPFKSIHYYEPQEYSSPDSPVGQLENVVVAHDDQAITYHPGRRCVNHVAWWCTRWFDPWTWKEAGPSESVLTYRSTVSSYRTTEDPSITLNFQGSGVYVYGAPKSFMKDGFASQHVCINDACHIVDAEQAYLNAPEAPVESNGISWLQSLDTSNATITSIHPELDPVLIWSMTGLDDKVQHSLRLALAGLQSQDNAEMSIARIVYTKVTYEAGQSRPDTPVPQPDYSYEGPVYPPHAIEWAPRLPSPKPDPPSDPEHPLPSPNPAPPNRPEHPHPHLPPPPSNPTNPSTGGISVMPYILWPMVGVISFIVLFILLVLLCEPTTSSERRRILPDTPPPPYTPNPRTPPRPVPPQPRYNPPPPKPKPAPPPVQPTPSHPGPNPHRSNKPIPKSDLAHVDPYRVPASPYLPIQSKRVKQSLKDQNNAGPCPGSNVAAPRPEYTNSIQKKASTSNQTTPYSSTNVLAPVQSAPSPSRNIANPISESRLNRSSLLAPSSSTLTRVPNPATHTVAPSSRASVDHVARHPPSAVLPAPKVPPKPNPVRSTTGVIPSAQTLGTTEGVVGRSERAVQPTPIRTTSNVRTTSALNPSERSTTHQTRNRSTSATSPTELPPPGLQQNAYDPTPGLSQWAEGQGYRIDRLVRAATNNERVRPRTRVRNQGQGQNAMAPFDPAVLDALNQRNMDQRAWWRTEGGNGRLPSVDMGTNQGAAPADRHNRGREPRNSDRVAPAVDHTRPNPNSDHVRTENAHDHRRGRGRG
ncbi:hypothetical protein OPQ81_007909 [Rhizoctonia solani]|nr:hypothetical protein OPQ81_007909 [Rhizoctonia solani]